MPFDQSDPRSVLDAQPGIPAAGFAEAQVIAFTGDTAQVSHAGSRIWHVRTQNAVVTFAQAAAGDALARESEPFEYLVALPDAATAVRISANGSSHVMQGRSLAVVPAGASTVDVLEAGPVIRVSTAAALDLLACCVNKDAYLEVPPNVAVHAPAASPGPVLTYRLADYPPTPDRFGHIFRSRNLMLNFIGDRHGPRDVRKLSPHSHPDFEQCSVQLAGQFVHHIRTPWTPDMTTWRDDQHAQLKGPGAVIFPPPLIHTSQAAGPGINRLLDVFSPVRNDFLGRPGWVLNAADFASCGAIDLRLCLSALLGVITSTSGEGDKDNGRRLAANHPPV